LNAVVQVAFDAVTFGLGRRHRALPGVAQRAHLVLQCGGGRRAQEPSVDRRVDRWCEHHDRGGGDERDGGQQPRERRRDEGQAGGVVAAVDGSRGGGSDEGERQQCECDGRGEDVVDQPQVVVRDRLPESDTADVEPQLVRPALKAAVVRELSVRDRDAEAEHRFAAHPLDPVDAAHQVDEDDAGEQEADDRRDGRHGDDHQR
jgi:hypothetical protein